MFSFKNRHYYLSKEEKEKPRTRSGKIVYALTSGLIIALAVLTFAGLWVELLIPNALFLQLIKWSLALAAIFYFYWLWFTFIGDTFVRRNTEKLLAKRGKGKWSMIFAMILVVPMFFVLSISKGLPLIGHYFQGQPSEIMLTVSKKSSSYHTKYCSGQIDFEEYPYLFNNSLCGIQESDWDQIQAGQKIVLIGKQSPYGFSTEQYRLLLKATN